MPQAGFGQVTVRAQIQAMTVAFVPSGERRLRVEVADAPLGLVAHPLAVGADVRGQTLGALPVADLVSGSAGEHRLAGRRTSAGSRSAPC